MDPLALLDLHAGDPRPLIVDGKKAHSRDDILRRAAGVARRLEDRCRQKGKAIIALDSGPEFVAALAGCWLAGFEPVLLDPLVKNELERAVEMAGAVAVLWSGRQSCEGPVARLAVGDERAEPPGASPRISSDEPVVYLFTSGSTGEPTLVPKTRANLTVETTFLRGLLGAPSRVVTLVQWCHIYGFIHGLLLPASLKGVCDLSPGISPLAALKRAFSGGADLVVSVPAVLHAMVRHMEAGGFGAISSSCRFVTAGAALPEETRVKFEQLSGCRLVDIYGSTEAGGIAYREDSGPWLLEPHVEARISSDDMIEVRSGSVSLPGPEGFYRVGDRGRLAGRSLELLGRADDVVKIGGRRTSLSEVERSVIGCPKVAVAAIVVRQIRGQPRLVAYVQPEKGAALTPDDVKSHVRQTLADHKVPHVVRFVDYLPLSAGGKVDRRWLRELEQKD